MFILRNIYLKHAKGYLKCQEESGPKMPSYGACPVNLAAEDGGCITGYSFFLKPNVRNRADPGIGARNEPRRDQTKGAG